MLQVLLHTNIQETCLLVDEHGVVLAICTFADAVFKPFQEKGRPHAISHGTTGDIEVSELCQQR
jgi:hypothetical protein